MDTQNLWPLEYADSISNELKITLDCVLEKHPIFFAQCVSANIEASWDDKSFAIDKLLWLLAIDSDHVTVETSDSDVVSVVDSPTFK